MAEEKNCQNITDRDKSLRETHDGQDCGSEKKAIFFTWQLLNRYRSVGSSTVQETLAGPGTNQIIFFILVSSRSLCLRVCTYFTAVQRRWEKERRRRRRKKWLSCLFVNCLLATVSSPSVFVIGRFHRTVRDGRVNFHLYFGRSRHFGGEMLSTVDGRDRRWLPRTTTTTTARTAFTSRTL